MRPKQKPIGYEAKLIGYVVRADGKVIDPHTGQPKRQKVRCCGEVREVEAPPRLHDASAPFATRAAAEEFMAAYLRKFPDAAIWVSEKTVRRAIYVWTTQLS